MVTSLASHAAITHADKHIAVMLYLLLVCFVAVCKAAVSSWEAGDCPWCSMRSRISPFQEISYSHGR